MIAQDAFKVHSFAFHFHLKGLTMYYFGVFLLFFSHSRRDLSRVFDIGFGQIEGILGIILAKEFFKKSN